MPLSREFVRDQRRQLRELTWLFAARFWKNDLVSISGDVRAKLVGIFAVLAAPGWIIPVLECIVFSDRAFADAPLYQRDWVAVPHKAVYLGLSMTILGAVITVLEWDSLLIDQRDYTVLRPLPVRLGTILAAKIATLALFWAALTLVINAVSAVVFPVAVIQKGSLVALLWTIRAHAVAVVAGNAFHLSGHDSGAGTPDEPDGMAQVPARLGLRAIVAGGPAAVDVLFFR